MLCDIQHNRTNLLGESTMQEMDELHSDHGNGAIVIGNSSSTHDKMMIARNPTGELRRPFRVP